MSDSQMTQELRKLAKATLLTEQWYTEKYLDNKIGNGEDSAYIAAANPAAILALLDERDQLQAECAEHKENAIRNARIAVSIRAERDALQSRLDALSKGEPVQFLCDATRFKVRRHEGDEASKIFGLPRELNGRWVALVAADDDCHLKLAAPKALAPLTDEQRLAIFEEVKWEGEDGWEYYYGDVINAVERAHGIGGTP